ncbi:MAG: hypothetical protein HY364_05300 [Candidatus Aenigmarchaeota archaeon]|nr:hypothetical protein [Candidatus Aenigmarchaeota archaeon]
MAFQSIGSVLTDLATETITFVPNLVGAIVLLVIGLVVGKVVGRVVKEVLSKVKLDYYLTETERPVISISNLFALITRWWIYVAFIVAAVDTLRIPSLSAWLTQILHFLPNVVGATTVMVVGYVLAEFVKDQLKKVGKSYSLLIGKITFFFIMYVAIAVALPILQIPATLISQILLIIIASMGAGIAVAMGLGLKDALSDVSRRYVKKMKV